MRRGGGVKKYRHNVTDTRFEDERVRVEGGVKVAEEVMKVLVPMV